MYDSPAEVEKAVALMLRLLDTDPPDWKAVAAAWLRLSLVGKATDLQAIIDDWIGRAVRRRDIGEVRAGLEALRVRLA